MAYYSSGDSPLATSGDSPITLLTLGGGGQRVNFFNLTHTTASTPFELSFDNGVTWLPCNSGPNGASVNLRDFEIVATTVKLRRTPAGTDISGIYAWAQSGD